MPNILSRASMYQAIETKYLGPSNVLGARVKATAEAGSVTLSWDHGLNADDNHRRAAEALIAKFNWVREGEVWHGGALSGRGYAFVCVGR